MAGFQGSQPGVLRVLLKFIYGVAAGNGPTDWGGENCWPANHAKRVNSMAFLWFLRADLSEVSATFLDSTDQQIPWYWVLYLDKAEEESL